MEVFSFTYNQESGCKYRDICYGKCNGCSGSSLEALMSIIRYEMERAHQDIVLMDVSATCKKDTHIKRHICDGTQK